MFEVDSQMCDWYHFFSATSESWGVQPAHPSKGQPMRWNAHSKAGVWFFFTILIACGLPVLIIWALAQCCEKPARELIVFYFGPSTAPLIAFALLMAATGDRIIEREEAWCLVGWVGLVDAIAVGCLLLPLYEHFVRGGGHPELIEVVLGAIPMVLLAITATSIKHQDWILAQSNHRISRMTQAAANPPNRGVGP
jgi:hypothetical protein